MADYRTVGSHQINKWLWTKLAAYEYPAGSSNTPTKAFGDYQDSGNSSGYAVVPIVPGHEWPQIRDITKGESPFLVYNYIMSPYSSEWWICREQCAYVLYDVNEERLRAIHAYMVDLLKRVDWTAREINNSSVVSNEFDFKYVSISSASGPDDFSITTEESLQGTMVVINYEYTIDMNSSEGNGLRV